jgi:hypothetical protein
MYFANHTEDVLGPPMNADERDKRKHSSYRCPSAFIGGQRLFSSLLIDCFREGLISVADFTHCRLG